MITTVGFAVGHLGKQRWLSGDAFGFSKTLCLWEDRAEEELGLRRLKLSFTKECRLKGDPY